MLWTQTWKPVKNTYRGFMAPPKAISQLMLPRVALFWSRSGLMHTFMYSHLIWYYWWRLLHYESRHHLKWNDRSSSIDKHWLLCNNAHLSSYMSRLQNNSARKAFANAQTTSKFRYAIHKTGLHKIDRDRTPAPAPGTASISPGDIPQLHPGYQWLTSHSLWQNGLDWDSANKLQLISCTLKIPLFVKIQPCTDKKPIICLCLWQPLLIHW